MSRKSKSRRARTAPQFQQRTQSASAVAPNRQRAWRLGAIFALLVIGGAFLYIWYIGPSSNAVRGGADSKTAPLAGDYVGAQVCAGCHAQEYSAWKGSQHAAAMQHANAQTVLGNFADAKFSYAGVSSTFFKRDEKFFVNTDGPDGKLQDFEIKYTFGVYPLQQYLIEMPDGRLQSLSIAWDARHKEQGGQHWFHLYPKERIVFGDELHWTRPAQNWNFMCADCHSTDLRKNYDPASNRFKTEWSEISVGCEACHGPGSRHLEWAARQSPALKKGGKGGFESTGKIPLNPPFSKGEELSKGLTARLDERRGVTWNLLAASGNAARSRPRVSEREIEVCAQCHARRGQVAEGYAAGKPFLDYYRPALLTPQLYHPDGQQRDEVYNWGSFLQSKMYAKGVTCSDCHEPHSGKLRAAGNQVCATCHQSSKYDAPSHHHHMSGSAGASCAACHMPTNTYMVVDPRHDHSLRVARPDLSLTLGTPNACNGCHHDHDPRWAAAQVTRWYGHTPPGYQRFAGAFATAEKGAPEAAAQLRAVAADHDQPAIARATSVAQLNPSSDEATRVVVAAALRDRSALIRLGALQSLANAEPEMRAALAPPLLSDPLRALRIEAASVLAPAPPGKLKAEDNSAFERAAAEYIASQRYNADRADARVNLGTFYAQRGDGAQAETEFKAALAFDPQFVPAYANLADLYRALGRDRESETTLRDGLKTAPKNATLHHALGLALVRLKRMDAALAELERAVVLEPGSARFAYVYAVALNSTGKSKAAIDWLEKTLARHPDDREVLEALVNFHQARGDSVEAKKYRDRLARLTNR